MVLKMEMILPLSDVKTIVHMEVVSNITEVQRLIEMISFSANFNSSELKEQIYLRLPKEATFKSIKKVLSSAPSMSINN